MRSEKNRKYLKGENENVWKLGILKFFRNIVSQNLSDVMSFQKTEIFCLLF